MESMLMMPDEAAPAMTSVREQEAEKCDLASDDPLTSPVFKESVEIAKNSDGGDANSAYPESVASERSMDSDASSNALNGDSQVSDADSPCEEKNLNRCPSGGSIVTYDEAPGKLREEGECERTNDRKLTRRSKEGQLKAVEDEQDTSINAGQKMADSAGPGWTEDKHCSYLNSMEQTFVNSLYGQDYRTVEGSGQDDQDCVESRPMYASSPYRCELFTSLQRGCYDQREYYRPQFRHNFAPSTSAIFLSPWIQHFNPKPSTPSHGGSGAAQDPDTGHPAAGFAEGDGGGSFVNEDVKEEVMESFPDFPETAQGPQSWTSRQQSQHYASTSAPVRVDGGIQAKKRPCNVDPCSDVTYRPKKLKSTQRMLAEIDVEMEEQFLLKQKHLKEQADCSDLKADPQPRDGKYVRIDLNQELEHAESGGFDLNQELERGESGGLDLNQGLEHGESGGLDLNQELKHESGGLDLNQALQRKGGGFDLNQKLEQEQTNSPNKSPRVLLQASDKTTDFTTSSKESMKSRDMLNASSVQAESEKKMDLPNSLHLDTAVLHPVKGNSGGESTGVENVVDAAGLNTRPGEKSHQVEANESSHADLGFDDEEELEFLRRRSPRASKTYTWGNTGPRRRLHNESDVLGGATALPGSVQNSRHQELQDKRD